MGLVAGLWGYGVFFLAMESVRLGYRLGILPPAMSAGGILYQSLLLLVLMFVAGHVSNRGDPQ